MSNTEKDNLSCACSPISHPPIYTSILFLLNFISSFTSTRKLSQTTLTHSDFLAPSPPSAHNKYLILWKHLIIKHLIFVIIFVCVCHIYFPRIGSMRSSVDGVEETPVGIRQISIWITLYFFYSPSVWLRGNSLPSLHFMSNLFLCIC